MYGTSFKSCRPSFLTCSLVTLQFYTDANEAESWLNEKMALVTSTDYGEDEPSAQALLQRHRDLEGELNAYSGDIASLNSQAQKLVQAGISTLEVHCLVWSLFCLYSYHIVSICGICVFFSITTTMFVHILISQSMHEAPIVLTLNDLTVQFLLGNLFVKCIMIARLHFKSAIFSSSSSNC